MLLRNSRPFDSTYATEISRLQRAVNHSGFSMCGIGGTLFVPLIKRYSIGLFWKCEGDYKINKSEPWFSFHSYLAADADHGQRATTVRNRSAHVKVDSIVPLFPDGKPRSPLPSNHVRENLPAGSRAAYGKDPIVCFVLARASMINLPTAPLWMIFTRLRSNVAAASLMPFSLPHALRPIPQRSADLNGKGCVARTRYAGIG